MKRIKTINRNSTGGGDIIIIGGSQGIGLDMGAETVTDRIRLETTLKQGTDTESMGLSIRPTIATGSSTDSMQISPAVTARHNTGNVTDSMKMSLATTRSTGSESNGSFAASAAAALSQHTASTTAVQNSGSPNWTNPNNTIGPFNATVSNHAGLSGLTNACNATLTCTLPALGAVPPGFTQGNVFIVIRQSWDLTITLPAAGVTDGTHTITLLDNLGLPIATLNTKTAAGGGGTQASLIDEVYNITGIASPAQIAAGLRISCNVNLAYVPAVNGNTSWSVDAVHLRTDYTRTGIT